CGPPSAAPGPGGSRTSPRRWTGRWPGRAVQGSTGESGSTASTSTVKSHETTPTDPDPLAQAIRAARADRALLTDLQGLYRQVDAEVGSLAIPCGACGACCAFEAFGHRLYVSTAELALLTLEPPP